MTDLPRVLFVDDDPNVLDAMKRSLKGRYQMSTALSAAEGLAVLGTAVFDVVVSDMRMPGMNGAEFLKVARTVQPEALRIILSGHSDLEAAVAAVNEGHIFRFLIKPAPRLTLITALDAAVEQRRLVAAEKELLERTLTGSIDALSETLALTNPIAFGRSRRLKRIVSALATEVGLVPRWPVEVAAMLSQLGAVTLPPETAERWYAGEALSEDELKMVARAAEVTRQLLRHIPRLEPVIALLDMKAVPVRSALKPSSLDERLLRAAMALEWRLSLGGDFDDIISAMQADPALDGFIVEVCRRLRGLVLARSAHRAVGLQSLQAGMVLAEDVRTNAGALLIAKGHEVSEGLMVRLRNFAATVGVKEPLLVSRTAEDEEDPALRTAAS